MGFIFEEIVEHIEFETSLCYFVSIAQIFFSTNYQKKKKEKYYLDRRIGLNNMDDVYNIIHHI